MKKLKHTSGKWYLTPDGYLDNEDGFCIGNPIMIRSPFREGSYDKASCNKKEEIEVGANMRIIASAPDLIQDKIKDFKEMGKWLSASLDDPNVCEDMKKDVRAWFDRFKTFEEATGYKIGEVVL